MSADSDSRREAIEAAFDSVEAAGQEAPTADPASADSAPTADHGSAHAETAGESSSPTPTDRSAPEPKVRPFGQDKPRDEEGKFAKVAQAKTPTPVKGSPSVTVKPSLAAKPATVTPTPVPEPAKTTGTELKAPQSWKPQAREKWAGAPPEVQAEAIRREREIVKALQDIAPIKQRDDAVRQTIEPYLPMIQASGANPLQVIGSFFQTAHQLTYGPPAQKAQVIAHLVKTYGVGIDELAGALDGQPQGQPAAQPPQALQRPQEFRDPRVDQMLQERAQTIAAQGQQAVEEFGADAEFADNESVRATMADMLEVAAKRGSTLTLEQAYNAAVGLHPDIQEVLSQRAQAQAANASQASTQRARRAASGIRSEPAGVVTAPQPTGRRAHIEAAFAKHDR